MQYKNLLENFFETVIKPQQGSASLLLVPENHTVCQQRMEVYQHGYKIRLAKSVVSDFPALQHYAGEKQFRTWARAYIDAVPSTNFNLDKYTFAFPAYLKTLCDDPIAMALAELEGGINVVFMEAESPALQLDAFSQLSPEQFANYQFISRPALRLFQFDYAINDYLTRFRAGENPTSVARESEYLVVCRAQFEVKRHVFDRNGFYVLQALCEGLAVGEAFEKAFPKMQEPMPTPEIIQAWFKDWIMAGFFAG